ncbi:MAG TPA: polymer-forming cytoskeletal protein [Methylophilaceae bacterium]|nr:polymer-forming cytoskeletal protein [Methylophilaceae bacterium]
MLSKQNIFKRNTEPSGAIPAKPISPAPLGSARPVSTSTLPGYPAESTPTVTTAPVSTEAKPAEAPKADQPSGSRLIVGPEVKLKGAEILNCDTLVVEGRVEATMDSRVIQIAAEGAFSGKVGIDVAEIHGKFDGELTARSQLIIHSTGKVSGKIRYGKILIEEGGELSGDVAAFTPDSSKAGGLRIAGQASAIEP